jgi:hypothetical protein
MDHDLRHPWFEAPKNAEESFFGQLTALCNSREMIRGDVTCPHERPKVQRREKGEDRPPPQADKAIIAVLIVDALPGKADSPNSMLLSHSQDSMKDARKQMHVHVAIQLFNPELAFQGFFQLRLEFASNFR